MTTDQLIDDINSDYKYREAVTADFLKTLEIRGDNEPAIQDFLEKNPSLVPGAYSMSGESGHSPLHMTLVATPTITGLFDRVPDFMWLAKDSLNFNPVLIEIEAPNKRMFRKNGIPTSEFTSARNQITEWKSILQVPENKLIFYNAFSIPQYWRKLKFEPHYVLIYGRRSEYENNAVLTQKRSNIMGPSEHVISFDRLESHPKCFNAITCNVKNGEYIAKYFNPTFKFYKQIGSRLSHMKGIDKAIYNSAYITDGRKKFLIERINETKITLDSDERNILPNVNFNITWE